MLEFGPDVVLLVNAEQLRNDALALLQPLLQPAVDLNQLLVLAEELHGDDLLGLVVQVALLGQFLDVEDLALLDLLLHHAPHLLPPPEGDLPPLVPLEIVVECNHCPVDLPQSAVERLLPRFLDLYHFLQFEGLDRGLPQQLGQVALQTVPDHVAALELPRLYAGQQQGERLGQFEPDGFSDEEQHLSETADFLEERGDEGKAVLDDHQIDGFGQ
jgi:hypothetical protein